MKIVKSSLRDKNGKSIYSGQIVTSHDGRNTGIVRFSNDFGIIINGDNICDCGDVEIIKDIPSIFKLLSKFNISFYKNEAEKLWGLLDDIDTASDIFKPCESNGIKSFEAFYKYSLKKVSERFNYFKSNGYNLY